MLKPGGKMVAIMGEGGFFRSDKKSQDFRNWLDDKGVSETLPPGSFKTSDNPTGVNTRLVTIQKGSKPKSSRSELDPDEADILLQVRDRKRKKDFNSHLNITEFGGNNLRRRKTKIANFAKPGCCCDASKPLRRRKTKQTPRLKRRGTRYA
jgi:hypothetical protein